MISLVTSIHKIFHLISTCLPSMLFTCKHWCSVNSAKEAIIPGAKFLGAQMQLLDRKKLCTKLKFIRVHD